MLGLRGLFGYGDAQEATDQATQMAEKAIAVDETFGWSYIALGWSYFASGQYEDAIAAGREAIARQPSDADSHAELGLILGFSGEYASGLEAIDQAIRLNPGYFHGFYLNVRGVVQTMAGEYEAALATFKENVDRGGPVAWVLAYSAAAHEGLGQSDEAAMDAKRLRAEFPRFTITNWNFLKIVSDDAVRERLVKLMRAAGVP
jgi:adenylate cyclase